MKEGRIRVHGVRASGRHGFTRERHHPQPFDVDVELTLDLESALSSDDLEETIDYGLIVQEIRRAVEQESYSLVESLAEAIAQRLLGFGAEKVTVCVSKPQAALALGADAIAVEIERTG